MPILTALALLALLSGTPRSGESLPEPEMLTPPEAPVRGPSIEAICARGEHLLEDGGRASLVDARRLFEMGLKNFPDAACAHAGLARTLVSYSLRRIVEDDALIDQALVAARKGVVLGPDSPVAHAALAFALLLDLQPDEAGAEAGKALELDPESSTALQARATTLMARGRLEPARETIERAIALHPGQPASYHALGNIQLMSGRRGEALDAYDEALKLAPDYLPSAIQIAAAFEEVGAYGRSGAIFRRLMQEHPEVSGRVHLVMGFSLMKREGWKEALAVLGKADLKTSRGLGNGTTIYLEALCYEQLERDEEAIAAFRRVIDDYPDATAGYATPERLMFPSYEGLSRIYLKARETEKAVAVLEEGLAHDDASPGLLLRLARLYDDYSMPDRALAVLERATAARITPRTAARQVAAYLLWARLGRRSDDHRALEAMARSLMAQRSGFDALADYVYDLDAIRALSIAGRGEDALAWLRMAVAHGYGRFAWMEEDPELDSLRAAPGFMEIAGVDTGSK